MIQILVSLILIGSWLFFLPGRFDGDQIFVLSSLMAVCAASQFIRPVRSVDTKWLAFCVLLAILTMFLNAAWFKVYMLTNLTLGAMAVKLIAERIEDDTFLSVILLNALLIAFLMLITPNIYATMYQDAGAFMGKPWALGSFAAISLPLVIRMNPAFGVAAAPLLFASRSSVCVLAGGVAVLWLLWEKRPSWAILSGLVGGLGAVFMIVREGGLESHRFEVWKNSLKYAIEHPIWGHGFGSWAHFGFAHSNGSELQHWPWAHNEFYQQFFEQGIVGFVILLAFLWSIRKCSRNTQAALLAMSILAFFHPVLHWAKLIPLCIVVFALAVKESSEASHGDNRARYC